MTTEGKSVQLFSQNIQLARLTAVTETGKSCVSESLGLLLLYFTRADKNGHHTSDLISISAKT